MPEFIPTVVVGAGYAGLAASHYLSLAGIEHVVLEKGRIGETWRTQRWDSFALNTNRRVTAFPGETYAGPDPEGFALCDEFVDGLDQYVTRRGLPVQTGVDVTELEAGGNEGVLRLRTNNKGTLEVLETLNVVVASGFQNEPVTPNVSSLLPSSVWQLHAADYRNAYSLPSGAVLVVGSAQSGCQIAEDLLEAGRRVFLSVSAVGRVPRPYRGRDMMEWNIETGSTDVRLRDLQDPKMQFGGLAALGTLGRAVSLQHLRYQGATLVGRLDGADGANLHFADNVADCIRFGDERSAAIKQTIDAYIERMGISAPSRELDPRDAPDDGTAAALAPLQVDVQAEGIHTVIWCTGFTGAFSWIKLPVFGENGRPTHERGVSPIQGIYYLGQPWLYKRKSGLLFGMNEDAEFIVQQIAQRNGV